MRCQSAFTSVRIGFLHDTKIWRRRLDVFENIIFFEKTNMASLELVRDYHYVSDFHVMSSGVWYLSHR